MAGDSRLIDDGENRAGEFQSPGGFVFGVVGWTWGEQRPKTITFFLDGTARVCDQHGRPVKGVVKDGKPVYFDKCSHAQTLAALAEERVDWVRDLQSAGWPQLPYDELRSLYFPAEDGKSPRMAVPPTPEGELKKIPDAGLRRDAMRVRREVAAEQDKQDRATDGG